MMGRKLILLVSGILVSGQVTAKEGDTIRPYIDLTSTYDDNFYKLNSDADLQNSVLKDSKRADLMTSLSAGVDVDWDYSNQNFVINTQISDNRFTNNTQFDNKSINYDGAWNWKIGRQFSGSFGYIYDKSLASFVDNQSFALEGASKIRRTYQGSGNWLFHPNWRTGVNLTNTNIDFVDTNSNLNNRENQSINAYVDYLTEKGSVFGFKIGQNHTNFPSRDFQPGNLVEENYTLNTYLFTTNWKASGKSTIKGQIGWESLKNKHLDERDFSDWSFNLSHIWLLTGKLTIESKIWNEVNPSGSLLATYERSKGIKVSSIFNLTPKNSFMLSGKKETRDLEGDPGYIDQSDKLSDQYLTASATMVHQLSENIAFKLGYQHNRRDSSADSRDYKSNLIFVSANAIW